MGRTVFPDGQVYAGSLLKHHDFAVGGAPATVKVGFVVPAVKTQCSYFALATGAWPTVFDEADQCRPLYLQ